tara:strand:+ start:4781 stop:5122 length:342 start_codon:yes stop_codon:yes gene_type:complete
MPFKLVDANNNLTIILIIVVFFVFVMPILETKFSNDKEQFSNCLKKYLISVPNKIDTLPCSRSCCNHIQWPVPHMKKNKNLATNMMCNGGNGSGCVCMKKKNFNNLSNRSGNA